MNPGRRVERSPQLRMRPAIDAVWPGLSEAIGCKAAAVFVAERKAVQQVFDGVQAGAREIGRAPRADALQVLERRGEEVV